MLAPLWCLRTSRPSCAPVNNDVKAGAVCCSVQAAKYVTRIEGGGPKSVTGAFAGGRGWATAPPLPFGEVVCPASLTTAPQVRRHLRLSVGTRQGSHLTGSHDLAMGRQRR